MAQNQVEHIPLSQPKIAPVINKLMRAYNATVRNEPAIGYVSARPLYAWYPRECCVPLHISSNRNVGSLYCPYIS